MSTQHLNLYTQTHNRPAPLHQHGALSEEANCYWLLLHVQFFIGLFFLDVTDEV